MYKTIESIITTQYDLYPFELNKIKKHYDNIAKDAKRQCEMIEEDMTYPYHFLIGIAGLAFPRADMLICKRHRCMIDSEDRCLYCCLYVLASIEADGSTRISDKELAYMVHELATECVGHIVGVVNNNNQIYYDSTRHLVSLKSAYMSECGIAKYIKNAVKSPMNSGMDWHKFNKVGDNELTNEQMNVLKAVNDNNICALTAAAGTGKTYTTNAIIQMLDAYNHSYTLLAPTGIAAKVLSHNTNREASTIHMFLARMAVANEYVIIDEMSMVSVELMYRLLSAIGDGHKVILVADEAQLASIQYGNVIQDIIDSGVVPNVHLTKVFRYGKGGISTIATDMRRGSIEHLTDEFNDYKFVQISNDPIKQAVDEYDNLINAGYTQDDIVVLCPYNKGNVGTRLINKAISDKYNPYPTIRKNSDIKIGSKVVNIVNDYSDPDNFIANGDIGNVQSYRYTKKDGVQIGVMFDSGYHNVNSVSKLLLAYSLSIHKSQGSQHKAVIVVVDKMHEWLITRNLLYVACSRAQERLVLISDIDVIKSGLEVVQNKERNTWLKELLCA